jgi:hypothetical protein
MCAWRNVILVRGFARVWKSVGEAYWDCWGMHAIAKQIIGFNILDPYIFGICMRGLCLGEAFQGSS